MLFGVKSRYESYSNKLPYKFSNNNCNIEVLLRCCVISEVNKTSVRADVVLYIYKISAIFVLKEL